MSVFELPGPHSSAPLFESLREIVEPYGQENEPLSYLASGYSDENGRYTSIAAELTLIPGDRSGQIALPHIVAYESEVREAVSNVRAEDWSKHAMYNELKSHWNQGERDWPEVLDAELEWPFTSRIDAVVRSVTVLAFDETLTSHMGPPPPASVGAGELSTEDAELDKFCRNIAAPKPLSADFVDWLVENGTPREEIPIRDITLDNVSMTKSDEWGHIWRADSTDKNASPPDNSSRAVCWRPSDDVHPRATWYRLTIEE